MGTNNCKSAYPSEEAAKKAVRALPSAAFAPLVSLEDDGGGELASFDPSEVMAKAYHTSRVGREESGRSTPSEEVGGGPLAFLGLQRKSAGNQVR